MAHEDAHRLVRLQTLHVIVVVVDGHTLAGLSQLEGLGPNILFHDVLNGHPGGVVHQHAAPVAGGRLEGGRQIDRGADGRKITDRCASETAQSDGPRGDADAEVEKAQVLDAGFVPKPPEAIEALQHVERASHRLNGSGVAPEQRKHRVAHELVDDAPAAENPVGQHRKQIVHDVLRAFRVGLRLAQLREAAHIGKQQGQGFAPGGLIQALLQVLRAGAGIQAHMSRQLCQPQGVGDGGGCEAPQVG